MQDIFGEPQASFMRGNWINGIASTSQFVFSKLFSLRMVVDNSEKVFKLRISLRPCAMHVPVNFANCNNSAELLRTRNYLVEH